MNDRLYKILPNFFQNMLVSIFNITAYRARNGKAYWKFREELKRNRNLSLEALKLYQRQRYKTFIESVLKHSEYYKKTLSNIQNVSDIDNIRSLPIIKKEDLRSNIETITKKTSEKLYALKTGGTTGKSLKVKYTHENMQERLAMLDDFRSRSDYELGKKTAWFSGKSLLTDADIKKNRFWKYDAFYKVRYYSTFHIKNEYLKFYVEDLMTFQPEYFVGFPSTILEIAKYGLLHGYDYPANSIKAIFPTAETITEDMRSTMEQFFKTRVYNQYASSEGAPFIIECENRNLHLELQSGVFEVLDENNQPTNSGKLVITAFATEATPLIRYDIGDSITLDDPMKVCGCGNNNPMVLEILGRIDDYIYSPENGKINLGNVSNTLKDTQGIRNFQVIQNSLDHLEIKVVSESTVPNTKTEAIFMKNWRDRVGNKMTIDLVYVDDIPVEKSGKFRIVKNNIKHLLT